MVSVVVLDEYYHGCHYALIASAGHLEDPEFEKGQDWLDDYICHGKHVSIYFLSIPQGSLARS